MKPVAYNDGIGKDFLYDFPKQVRYIHDDPAHPVSLFLWERTEILDDILRILVGQDIQNLMRKGIRDARLILLALGVALEFIQRQQPG